MRIPGCARGHIPRVAEEVRVLEDEAQRSVVRVLPEGCVEADGAFLDGPILAIGRLRIAVADQRVLVGGIDDYVPANVVAAVISEKQGLARRVLEAIRRGRGMQRRGSAVGQDDQIGRLAEQIPAGPIA